ncbi:hypothetical protein E3Q18_02684 [Wallemia mellicola]|uniref:peptidylprolyl isomerase n=1 Tax=Wallemia mellicola TaxID=1708541 RepID=A0AB38MUL5_9BASI|nr:hypothetical protein E3Q18_02684 [Wallemia mellicola]TIC54535.1 hypothetical protein E3Q04_02510 [Wallemia mellicola]TIC64101.1 hypothetical protein E3Q02_02764 [Wallemia mellicola]
MNLSSMINAEEPRPKLEGEIPAQSNSVHTDRNHPSANCWELPYVWSALTRFIPGLRDEILEGVRELEDALMAPPSSVHPTVLLVMESIMRIFKPQMKNVEADAINKHIHAQLSDIKFWPEEDAEGLASPEQRPLQDGKSFWEAEWREKVSVMRHLVDLMLSTPQIKDYIEKSYRVSTVERHRKRRDDPIENPIVLPPLGEDSKRQRLWVIEDKPRVYISGNPWKKSTTMTAITNTIEDVEALAKSYAMSSYQTERKAAEIVQHDKMMWKQLINQSKKEKDLSELLAGQWDGSFIRRCEREEARVAKIRKRNKEREEAEMHLAKQIEEQKAMGSRKRKSTKKPGFVTDIKDEDIDGEEEDDDAETEGEAEEDELEDDDKDADNFKEEKEDTEDTQSRRSKRQRNQSQTPSKQGTPSEKSTRSSSQDDSDDRMNPRVFIDWNIDGEYAGRLVFELYSDKVPKTAENFKALCTGEKGTDEETGNKLTYKDSISHRIIKGFMIQFGDITNHNGTGGLSIYGGKFEDENFDIKHTKRGQLSMANAGPNTNGSQVFVTFCPCPHLDGRHVVFGEISKGKGLLRRLENIQTGENDYPTVDVRIVDSGLVKEGEDDGVPPLSIGEHEDYPEDDEADSENPEVALKIAKYYKDKGADAFKQQNHSVAVNEWEKALRYLDVNPVLPDETKNEIKAEYSQTRVQLYLNVSIAALKLNKPAVAESMATKAIRTPPTKGQDIAKGLYRRALAKSARKNDHSALDDLNHAGFEIESDLPRLARSIQQLYYSYQDVIPDTIYKYLTQQPHKTQLYASLILLLSISYNQSDENDDNNDDNVGQKVLDYCLISWKECLESKRWLELKIGTNFFASLVPALISPDSFYETINTFIKVIEEPGVSSLRAEKAIECASEALMYASSFLTTQSKEKYDSYVSRIEHYIQNEDLNDVRLVLYPWVNLPKNNSSNKVDNCVDPIQIYGKTLRSLADSEFKEPQLPLFDIEEVLPTVREVDPALRTELPSVLIPADDYNTTISPNSETSRWKLQILEDDSIPSPESGDGVIIYSLLRDMMTLYNRNRIDCAKILTDLPTFIYGNLFDGENGYNLESTLVTTLLSELLSLPEPKHPKLYYSSLMTELCKREPKRVAPALGRSIRKLYTFIGEGLDIEIIFRLSEWFATHLSNFGFNWVWKEWIPDLDLPESHPKKTFIKRIIELEIRLSYFDRIAQSLPEAILNKPELITAPSPNFIYANEENPFNGIAMNMMDALKNRATSDQLTAQFDKIEDEIKVNASLPLNDVSAKKVSRDIISQCLLNVGSRSFSHFLNVIEKYMEILKKFYQEKEDRIDLLRSVDRFWIKNSQMKKIIVDKLLQYRLLDPTDVINWLFKPNDETFPNEIDDRNPAIAWSDINFGELLKTTLNKVNSRVYQQGLKLAENKKKDEEEASIAKAKSMQVDDEGAMTVKNEENKDNSHSQITYDNLKKEQRECFVILIKSFVEALEGVDSIADLSIEEYSNSDWDKWLSWSWYQAFLREYWPSISEAVETITTLSFEDMPNKEQDPRWQLWKSTLALSIRCN